MMSRDSSRSYIHLRAPHHADVFEEFSAQPTTLQRVNGGLPMSPSHAAHPSAAATTGPHNSQSISQHTTLTSTLANSGPNTTLPYEDIAILPQHQPVNPEDEDDVVPDMHAAFGITRAMAQKEGRERAWKDFESLKDLVRGVGVGVEGKQSTGSKVAGRGSGLPR